VRRALIGMIRIYQVLVRPLLPPTCRYTPGCSEYAIEAIRRFGILGGPALAAWRLLRCAPWGGWGPDPVPDRFWWWKWDK
jgi:putative membrane protein insertion efficiency factor